MKSKVDLALKPIAVVGPFSGPRAVYGKMLKKGIFELCQEYPDQLEIEFFDDRGDPSNAEQIARRIVARNKVAVIGHFNSFSALNALPFYRKAKIPLLLPASTNMDISKSFNNILRFCSNDLKQVHTIKSYCLKNNLLKGFLFHDETQYGKELITLFKENSSPISVLSFEDSELEEENFVFFAGTHYNAAQTVMELRRRKFQGTIFLSDDSYTDEFIELVNDHTSKCLVISSQETYEETTYMAAKYLIDYSNVPNYYEHVNNCEIPGFSSEGERYQAKWILTTIKNGVFVEVE
ncbi:ABC transporter substrate-binding protein [Niallia taxi]|uniref:ABC transporter substrate-binding protein n=1 Tax=Niallia taxi TaxID=2499688 RepID=UPI00203C8DA0|nr:ABC transporter substrate-binding protein [Niallia taxi]MCM3216676.1 ABC transporter substrate-binding protein [Niallia taxi]